MYKLNIQRVILLQWLVGHWWARNEAVKCVCFIFTKNKVKILLDLPLKPLARAGQPLNLNFTSFSLRKFSLLREILTQSITRRYKLISLLLWWLMSSWKEKTIHEFWSRRRWQKIITHLGFIWSTKQHASNQPTKARDQWNPLDSWSRAERSA